MVYDICLTHESPRVKSEHARDGVCVDSDALLCLGDLSHVPEGLAALVNFWVKVLQSLLLLQKAFHFTMIRVRTCAHLEKTGAPT